MQHTSNRSILSRASRSSVTEVNDSSGAADTGAPMSDGTHTVAAVFAAAAGVTDRSMVHATHTPSGSGTTSGSKSWMHASGAMTVPSDRSVPSGFFGSAHAWTGDMHEAPAAASNESLRGVSSCEPMHNAEGSVRLGRKISSTSDGSTGSGSQPAISASSARLGLHVTQRKSRD